MYAVLSEFDIVDLQLSQLRARLHHDSGREGAGSTYHSLRTTAVRSEHFFVSVPAPLVSWLMATLIMPIPARTSLPKVGSGRHLVVVADTVLASSTVQVASSKRMAADEVADAQER